MSRMRTRTPCHRRRALLAALLFGGFGLAACDGTGLRAGGEYSGVPDIPLGGTGPLDRYGSMTTGGTVTLNRELIGR